VRIGFRLAYGWKTERPQLQLFNENQVDFKLFEGLLLQPKKPQSGDYFGRPFSR
jgi:hypothetical protein